MGIRLYDVSAQRKPLFELVVGHGAGAGTGGYTGTVDDQARPLKCGTVASVRGAGDWSLFVGNTMGVLREYDLRNLPACSSSPFAPGRKKHLNWAGKQMPFKRGYKGVMGSIRDIGVHCSGEALVAVGIGRFAYVFETRKKRMHSKVYLKQKLCSVLVSSEERKSKQDSDDDANSAEEADAPGASKGEAPDGSEDEVAEGFSSDSDAAQEEEAAGNAAQASAESADEGPDMDTSARPPRRRRKRSKAEVERQQTTVILPDAAGTGKKKAKRRKKVQAAEEVRQKAA